MDLTRIIDFTDSNNTSEHGDAVVCNNCESMMIINKCEETCPSCYSSCCLGDFDLDMEDKEATDLIMRLSENEKLARHILKYTSNVNIYADNVISDGMEFITVSALDINKDFSVITHQLNQAGFNVIGVNVTNSVKEIVLAIEYKGEM